MVGLKLELVICYALLEGGSITIDCLYGHVRKAALISVLLRASTFGGL